MREAGADMQARMLQESHAGEEVQPLGGVSASAAAAPAHVHLAGHRHVVLVLRPPGTAACLVDRPQSYATSTHAPCKWAFVPAQLVSMPAQCTSMPMPVLACTRTYEPGAALGLVGEQGAAVITSDCFLWCPEL